MILELIGVSGAILFLLGFFQVATNKWSGKSFYYEACNLLGAILLGVYAFQKDAYMNIILNLAWGTVALYVIWHAGMRHQTRKQKKSKKTKHKA